MVPIDILPSFEALKIVFAGGLAGQVAWTVGFPIDSMKTIV